MIAKTSGKYHDLLTSVIHLSFFGTPHSGASGGAGFLRSLGAALLRSKESSLVRGLELWSKSLIEANMLFAGIAPAFTITTFYETETYNGVMVSVNSSRHWVAALLVKAKADAN